MHVLLISGSGNLDGQTSRALSALLEGVRSGGGEGEIVFLPSLKIARCQHCDHRSNASCGQRGRCLIEDDFAWMVERLRRSDAAAFATPVYFGGSAAVLRAFLHRLKSICAHPDGRRGIAGTPAVGVCVGGGAASCAEKLSGVLTECGFEVVAAVTAPRRELHLALPALQAAGRRLAEAVPARRRA